MISAIVVSIEGWQVMALLCLRTGVVIDGDVCGLPEFS